ncbi:MAG: 1-acyl-sn-glycerol-3-phosphate acyltransferase [Microthrixaceae bacterium]
MALEVGQLQTPIKAMLKPAFKFAWRVTTEGIDNIPKSGGAIIAPNHLSVLDSFFVPCMLPRRITYVGKAEYLDDWKTRVLFPAMGMIPIDRRGGEHAKNALEAAADVLRRGELFGIYPEGTRSRSGMLHRGHTGMARLAMETNSPIVPVGLLGTLAVQPPDAKFPRPFRNVHIRFGEPISPERYLERMGDRLALRQLTDEVMWEIRRLTGQEYSDTYATKSAKPAEETPQPVAAEAASSATVLSGAGAEVRAGRHLRPAATASPSSAVTRPSSSSVLAARPLVPAGGGSAAPRAADMDVANQRPDAAEPESGSDDLIDRASSATVLKPRPLTPV